MTNDTPTPETPAAKKTAPLERRADAISDANIATAIVQETASGRNPYLAKDVRVHGYSLRQMMGRLTFSELLFLNLRGELPTRAERAMLDCVLAALSAPGPRHPASRAVMYASASKTEWPNVLPMGLAVLSGDHLGAKECADAMKFLRRNVSREPAEVLAALGGARTAAASSPDGNRVAAGFGSRYGGRDPLCAELLKRLSRRRGDWPHLRWAQRFGALLSPHGLGPLTPALAAAAFLDLGFDEPQGCGVFQLAAAPQLIALGAEMAAKGPKGMPWFSDERYIDESRRPDAASQPPEAQP